MILLIKNRKFQMKVVFIIEQPEILRKLINPNEPNPGFGGTSFTAIRLALAINKSLNSY